MSKNKIIKCPLTGSTKIRELKLFDTADICQAYYKQLQIDVSMYFNQYKKIMLYENIDTDFNFFYPFDIDGNSFFYEKLSQFSWYYMDWKWEHEVSIKHIPHYSKLLEIGCANGKFLFNAIQKKRCTCVGIELNNDSLMAGKKAGLNIQNIQIGEHANTNKNFYDVICAFQVIEHSTFAGKLIREMLSCLKTGGKLIVSVPNQDSFIGLDDFNILDMPPHHMSKWNENALISLEKFFPLRLLELEFEPLQQYHYNYFTSVVRKKLKNDFHLHEIMAKISKEHPEKIRGHSVLAAYEKLSDEQALPI